MPDNFLRSWEPVSSNPVDSENQELKTFGFPGPVARAKLESQNKSTPNPGRDQRQSDLTVG